MNRRYALAELEALLDKGFSAQTVRDFINRIYDSIENQPIPNVPNIQKIPNREEKAVIYFSTDLLGEIFERDDIETFDEEFGPGKILIISKEYGKLFYFPKADKVQITKDNVWKLLGFNWLYKNIKSHNTK